MIIQYQTSFIHCLVHSSILVCIIFSRYFEDTSVGLLTQCYAADESKARILLVRKLKFFGNTTGDLIK